MCNTNHTNVNVPKLSDFLRTSFETTFNRYHKSADNNYTYQNTPIKYYEDNSVSNKSVLHSLGSVDSALSSIPTYSTPSGPSGLLSKCKPRESYAQPYTDIAKAVNDRKRLNYSEPSTKEGIDTNWNDTQSLSRWKNINSAAVSTSSMSVVDYLSTQPPNPLSFHNLLKYSTPENVIAAAAAAVAATATSDTRSKKDLLLDMGLLDNVLNVSQQLRCETSACSPKKAKKLKKMPQVAATATLLATAKSKGDMRVTTALDGSVMYCCTECHMAYANKNLLQQHLLGHTVERRFFCDICGAGLKRKDHLTRHKQSHNPDRPHACSVCSKTFKRKEQLSLHYVIHSGEKRHVCPECGKGFYRKDHLRKHTRSHMAKKMKSEISQYVPNNSTKNSCLS